MKFEPQQAKEWGLDFVKAPAKIDRGVSIAVYADPGKGKTTLACTLPEAETLIINTEAGLGPTLGSNHVIFNLTDVGQLDDLIRYLTTHHHPFKNVVVDNVSELEQKIILHLTHIRKKEFTELKEYGDASNKLRDALRDLRDLTYKGINVVFNAWEAPIELKNKDGEIVTKIFPKLSKKIAPELCGIVDMVAHLEVFEKTGDRWLRFGQTDQYITKSQFKGLDDGEPACLPSLFKKVKNYDYTKKGDANGVVPKKKEAIVIPNVKEA